MICRIESALPADAPGDAKATLNGLGRLRRRTGRTFPLRIVFLEPLPFVPAAA
jgi:hypothetical protein